MTEEITARGLKPGDPVGELPDPNATHHNNEMSALAGGPAGASNKNERGVGGGIYRPGGPTTIFGSSGWGPYSDGPLNAVRKSVLSRDGVTEENWMWMMATRVLEAGEEFSTLRKEALKNMQAADGTYLTLESVKQPEVVQQMPETGGEEIDAQQQQQQPSADLSATVVPKESVKTHGVGVYEPHANIIHCGFFRCFLDSFLLFG